MFVNKSILVTVIKCQNLGILVRDDAARDELRRQVGEIGLIMFVFSSNISFDVMSKCVDRTLYESKGLEFDDVNLFKIFCVPMISPLAFRSFFISSSRTPLWI